MSCRFSGWTQSWVLLLLLLSTRIAIADNWPNWRGPHQNGSADGKGYATTWSSDENIVWKLPLPGRGASTPVIWEDNLFLTYVENARNIAVCLDRRGNRKWQVDLGAARDSKHGKASGANSSPLTDGKHVYFYFKSGALACLDFDGNVIWRKNLQEEYGEDTLWWDLGTSPVLSQECLIVACQQTGDAYIVAFAKDSGDVIWRQPRDLNAPNESNQSYTTPLVLEDDARETLIVLGADHVTAHDVSDGTEIWRVGGLNPERQQYYRSIASAVASEETIFAPYARGASLTAIRRGGKGDVTDTHVSWISKHAADVPTPAYARGRVYVCKDKLFLYCLDAATQEVLWFGTLERERTTFSSSPVVADGYIYVTREDGTTFVVRDGDEFKVVARNELGEQTVATPAFVDGRIYLRTYDHLYCIGE